MNSKKTLLNREWILIALVLGFFCFVVALSERTGIKVDTSKDMKIARSQQEIQITLEGAVQAPGVHSCTPGISLRALLSQVDLSKNADRKKIPYKKILYSSQRIEIPRKK